MVKHGPAATVLPATGLATAEPQPDAEPMRMVRFNPAFSRLLGSISQSAVKVPSMMSMLEKRVLFTLARERYTGSGLIIDAGIFLGASTVCFGEGLRQNRSFKTATKRWTKPIISFERAIINPGMPAFFKRNNVEGMAEPGESFADAVEAMIEPVADLVDLRLGDILETGQGIEDPIEILFLDVLKLPEISRFVMRNYFPRLIPGVSIVVQQDYFYERLPFIKTDQEFFSEYFTFIGEVCSTALFLCTKPIPESAIDQLEQGLPAREQERLASRAMQRSCDPARRYMMAISKVRLIKQLYGSESAQDYLRFVKNEFPDQVASPLPRLKDALAAIERVCWDGDD
ncbi:hypothetical protein [Novosphingobium sp.]|uniref:hypothetical protein n=1 Tax=Novosphingobium sp. TaxID=1874826 RepID=UPI001D69A045|nr:hypothetical protein [Novosphingobium sp.]MBX9664026.1 hypothetical protein [Novosphingobium sp.]